MESPKTSKPFYGYYIVAACFVILFMLWGVVLNTFPVFVKPIAENMDWSRGALMVALLVGSIGTVVSAPIAGKLIDRLGAKPVMTAGTLMIGIGMIAVSRVMHLAQLYVVFGFIGFGLMFTTIIPCSFIISNWFISRRGTAMGTAYVGTGVGGMIGSPIVNWLIQDYSWRVAFAAIGGAILLVVLPVIFFLVKTRPSDMGLEPYRDTAAEKDRSDEAWGVGVKEAFSLRVFWLIAAIMLIVGMVSGGVANNCVAYFTDMGHSATKATYAWTVALGVMVVGKILIGPIADRWGAKETMAGICALFSVSILLLSFAQLYFVVIIFAALYGFASSAPLTVSPLLTSTNLGMKNFGTIYGILTITLNVGGAIGPVIAGFFYDFRKTYLPIFYVFAGFMLVALIFTVLLKPIRHKA